MITIRTQDREELLKINNVKTEMLKHGDVRSCHIVCSSYDLQSTSYIIGTYATKERALQVLDEIQEVIKNGAETYILNGKSDMVSRTYGIFYQMPKK